jgi:carbon monoxide dehydrogenase subunit G
MRMDQSFDVLAPLDRVWEALVDVERVAPCLPGATLTGHGDDGEHLGTFQVKLGPTTASYRGSVRVRDIDPGARTATLHAKGTDRRGRGGASATIVSRLEEIPGGTRIHSVTDLAITGKLGRFGRTGMLEDISNRLLEDFAVCLQQSLAAQPAAATRAIASGPSDAPAPEDLTGGIDSTPVVTPAATAPVRGLRLVLSVALDRALFRLGPQRLRRFARRLERIANRATRTDRQQRTN